ncbi:hypothetical protein BGZ60DRAFT_383685 [Tricladium varicosporioides]|nr:hypothetical protein BGZ60DRAFT_383685 [Hymenoscyphus varicosporioides]
MAVSVQAPLYSKPGMWNLGDPPNALPSTGSDAITTSMTYQYPMPTSSSESSFSMIPSHHHLPSLDHPQSQTPNQGPLASPGIKNAGDAALPKSSKIKRSMSTPNVRGQATAEAAALADKRRNKLGYHRTSVACGHCRRRKIRCIPSAGDLQNRCSNCIRLKKECNFYPVDQQPQPDPRRRGSKSQGGAGRVSASSSPSTTSGQIPEIPSNLPYPSANMPSIQDLGGPQMKRQRTESFSPENKGVAVVTSSREFNYNHGPTNWMAPDASPGIKQQGEIPQQFWRPNPQDSPLTPAFSPFTPSLQIPPTQSWPTPHPEPSPRDDMSWSVPHPPQRSISYSNLEGLQHQQQQFPAYSQAPQNPVAEHYTTKPRVQHTGMYPPPLATSTSGMMTTPTSATTNESLPHPHSAGSLPPSAFQGWPQQQSYAYQKPPPQHHEGYQNWTAPHEGLPRPPGYSGDSHAPAPAYGYPDPQQGMYYQGPPHQGHPGR